MLLFFSLLAVSPSAATSAARGPPRSSLGGPALVPSVPHLRGIFLSLYSADAHLTAAQWDRECGAMAAVGIEFVAVRAALVGSGSATAGGCTLGTYTAYYPTTLAPAGCYTRAPAAAGGNALALLLDGAAAHGLAVHVTPAMPHTPFGWPPSASTQPNKTDAAYFGELAELQAAAFEDVWAAFPQHARSGTLAGVYTALEQWNSNASWMNERVSKPMAADYFEPLAKRVHALVAAAAAPQQQQQQQQLQVWASPYYVGNLTLHPTAASAASYAAYWAAVWAAAPSFGWIALQDSRGWQGNDDAEVALALAALQGAAAGAGPGQELWSNVELFEGWPLPCEYPTKCGRHPAPIARIVAQLASEDRFVGGRHIAWEWASCLSPFTNANTSKLYHDYAAYVGANATSERE
jgi:hypothetical protein